MSMFNKVTKTFQWGPHQVTLETGEIARQSTGAVVVNIDDTVVLATVVAKTEAKPGQDFFPLTVDYTEKTYAAGKIPGSFFKREGRPSEAEILTCRLIDRPIRPLFPEGFYNEVQVVAQVLSLNPEVDSDIPADKKILAIANIDEALFAMAPGEIYVSTDDAASWSRVDVTLPFERIRNWTYYKNILFVTCDQGIFYTKDRGNTWTSLNDGLESPDLTVVKIAFDHIFVVNNAVTVLKRSISELLSTSENLAENQMMLYPNPADLYFTIPFIPGESNLQYRISDMKGAVVRSGKTADGGQVNVNNLTAGMYIVTVMSEKGNLTGKLIIQR